MNLLSYLWMEVLGGFIQQCLSSSRISSDEECLVLFWEVISPSRFGPRGKIHCTKTKAQVNQQNVELLQ